MTIYETAWLKLLSTNSAGSSTNMDFILCMDGGRVAVQVTMCVREREDVIASMCF